MKQVTKSILSLSSLKLVDFIFPLLIIPLFISKFGIDTYGIVSFFQTLAILGVNAIDFGFNVVGIQRLARNSSVIIERKYITASFIIKLFLSLLFCFIYLLVCYFSPYKGEGEIYIIMMIVPLLSSFNFQWYFQFKEKFRFLIITSLLIRIICFLLFLFISVDDLYNAVFLVAAMYSFPSLIHFFYQIKNKSLSLPKLKYIKLVFLSNILVFTYRFLNSLILPFYLYGFSFTLNLTQMGVLAVSQRVLGAVINFSTPITQALIPSVAKLKGEIKLIKYKKYLERIFLLSIVVMIFSVILAIVLLTNTIDGVEYLVIPVLMMLTIPPHVCNGFISNCLVQNGESQVINKIIIISYIVSVIPFLVLIYFNSQYTVFCYTLLYWIMLSGMYYALKKL